MAAPIQQKRNEVNSRKKKRLAIGLGFLRCRRTVSLIVFQAILQEAAFL
jgi:hypothetical protein